MNINDCVNTIIFEDAGELGYRFLSCDYYPSDAMLRDDVYLYKNALHPKVAELKTVSIANDANRIKNQFNLNLDNFGDWVLCRTYFDNTGEFNRHEINAVDCEDYDDDNPLGFIHRQIFTHYINQQYSAYSDAPDICDVRYALCGDSIHRDGSQLFLVVNPRVLEELHGKSDVEVCAHVFNMDIGAHITPCYIEGRERGTIG